jgi:hypothetical protein
MLDADLKTQLKAYLERVVRPIHITASVDDGAKSREMLDLLEDLVLLSDQISLDVHRDSAERTPSFALTSPGHDIHLRFAGLPLGHEFTSLVLALLQVGGHPSKATAEVIEQVRNLPGEYVFETYFSLSCQNCPDVVQALNLAAVLNPNIKHVAIDGALFQDEVEARQIMSVPTVYLNGEVFDQGRMSLEQIVAKLDTGAAKRDAANTGMVTSLLGGLMMSDEGSKKQISSLKGKLAEAYSALGGKPSHADFDDAYQGGNMPETEYPSMPQSTRFQPRVDMRQAQGFSYNYKDPSAPGAAPGGQMLLVPRTTSRPASAPGSEQPIRTSQRETRPANIAVNYIIKFTSF